MTELWVKTHTEKKRLETTNIISSFFVNVTLFKTLAGGKTFQDFRESVNDPKSLKRNSSTFKPGFGV